MAAPSNLTQRLREVLRLYQDILTRTQKHLDLEAGPDPDPTDLIDARKKNLTRIMDLEIDFPDSDMAWNSALEALPAEEAETARELTAQIRSVVAGILEADARLKARTQEEMARLRLEMTRFRSGQKILKAYGPAKVQPAMISRRR